MELFWEIFLLLLLIYFLSTYVGWCMGINHEQERISRELREEIKEEMRKKYYAYLVEAFNKRVEERAIDLASYMLEEYKKENEKEDI